MDKLEIALQQEMQLRAGIIKQPLEGLLYDLDLMSEQCKSDVANMRRVAVEVLRREIERLKKDGRCIAEAKEIYHKGMIDAKIEIEQLKKEKKWLIKACTEFMYGTIEVTSWKDAKDKVLKEMQEELKE